MEYKNYFFYECSKEDLCKIFNVKKIENTEIHSIIHFLEDRGKSAMQADYNKDFKKSFSDAGWKKEVQVSKDTHIGMTCDFQKNINGNQVYLEIQFGKTEAILKDVCKMQIAYNENSLDLGILIVPFEPRRLFENRQRSIGGMAYFKMAKLTLPHLHFRFPIWLIGLNPINKINIGSWIKSN